MRRDPDKSPSATNGSLQHPNGSTSPVSHKSLQSGSSNGVAQTNGSVNGSSPKNKIKQTSYYGHDRQEVSRLIIQALQDLGYSESANRLIQESGFDLESPNVAALRHAVLEGEWAEAEALLLGSSQPSNGGVSISNGFSGRHDGLPLAEGVDKDELRFQLRRQKYLELLEERDHGSALMVLRQEITPLHRDVQQLHILSGYMVCPSAEDLKAKAQWDGAVGTSRNLLLSELSKSISPSVMIPGNRLAVLFDQVKQSQISKCLYHNPTVTPSLFSNHLCDRNQFPLQVVRELPQSEEVWFLAFSPNGKMLATCGGDKFVTIYDTATFEEIHRLSEHTKTIPYVAWSPDSSKILSCSQDNTAKLWNIDTGVPLTSIINHSEPVTTAAWTPDGSKFITGSLDQRQALNMWSENGSPVYKWSANHRVQDIAISPNGKKLVTISPHRQVYVYNLETRTEEYSMMLQKELTCVNISQDSRFILVNLASSEIQLIDLETGEVVQRFIGQKQGHFIIRSTFGGTDENLVLSGSEDGNIYIFHKDRGTLIETLEGHPGGCANAIAWNNVDPCMFASCGDDKKVRIWSKPNETSTSETIPGPSSQFR